MSDCPKCGEPPSICRCNLATKKTYIVREYRAPLLPLDRVPAKLAMARLEFFWREVMRRQFYRGLCMDSIYDRPLP